jgi:transcriptional regulator with XRE-family HTH domain
MITLPMKPRTFAKLARRIALQRAELAGALGLSTKHIQRYETGLRPIPESTAKLIIMFARHGVPDDFRRTA